MMRLQFQILKEEKQIHSKSQNWTFRQHRFSCHHQQCMRGSTKLQELEFTILATSNSITQATGQNKLCNDNVTN